MLIIRRAPKRLISTSTLAGVAVLSHFPTFSRGQTCSWHTECLLNYSVGFQLWSQMACAHNIKTKTWKLYYAFKIVWGPQTSFGGKNGEWFVGVFLQKSPDNSTLLLFSRHICLGVETQGETWSASWGAGRRNLQESLCVHCNTLCLFLDLHLGRSLSLLGVWVTAGGVQGHKPGSEDWAGQQSAPAEILLEQD